MQENLQHQDSPAAAAIERAQAYAAEVAVDPAESQTEAAWQAARHPINLRLTVPFPFGRFYLTILAGKERRNPERRVDERRKNPIATKWNIAFLGLLGLVTGLALFTVIQFAARMVLERAGVV